MYFRKLSPITIKKYDEIDVLLYYINEIFDRILIMDIKENWSIKYKNV